MVFRLQSHMGTESLCLAFSLDFAFILMYTILKLEVQYASTERGRWRTPSPAMSKGPKNDGAKEFLFSLFFLQAFLSDSAGKLVEFLPAEDLHMRL